VQKYTSRATVLSDVSSEITMQLPMDEVKKFPEMFNEIDTKKEALGISTYGISITTLEEVFLKVG
jgi:ATP-binding cassette subfamily A (ABC1) protein 3